MRYIRGAFEDKPFTLGRYEGVRIRSAIAELAANGGAPMGFYANFKEPAARREIVRYYQFLQRYASIYRANRPHAEVLLRYPRTQVHEGDISSVARFKEIGRKLLDEHVLFDVLPDDIAADTARYSSVVDSSRQLRFDDEFVTQLPGHRSRFQAPRTVRVSATRPIGGGELTLHFVNYNREEPRDKASSGSGIQDEKPIAADGFPVDVLLPEGHDASDVVFLTPEEVDPRTLRFESSDARVRFQVPSFLVYGVARISMGVLHRDEETAD
jgi:hypothetical protein